MAEPSRIIVILPAYNEQGKIGNTVRKVLNDPPAGLVTACLVVDDGSTDGTVADAKKYGATVLSKERNEGVGSAIREGLSYAKKNSYDIIIVMAGDDQDVPEEIPAVVAPIIEGGYDFVQGSRRLHGVRTVNMPLFRRITTRVYSIIFKLFTGFPCTDGTNGFRAFRTSILDNPAIKLDQQWLNTYELEPYLFFKTIEAGFRVREVSVTKHYHKNIIGYSKMVPFKDWWNILKPIIYLKIGIKK